MIRSLAGRVCVTLLLMSAPVLAHHSAAGIDRTKTQVVTGTNSKGKAFTNTVVYERQP